MASQSTVSFDTVDSTVVMKITGINSDVANDRIVWYIGTDALSDTG